jgi:hypothetical protein
MTKAKTIKPARKRTTKAADDENNKSGPGDAFTTKRAKAYAHLEPHLCAVMHMGTIASNLFDCTDKGLYDFAVHHLEEMLTISRLATTPWTSAMKRRRRSIRKRKRQRIAARARRLRQ